jgi:hypothetical protein
VLLADFKKSVETQIKSVSGGFLLQDLDQKIITKNDLKTSFFAKDFSLMNKINYSRELNTLLSKSTTEVRGSLN